MLAVPKNIFLNFSRLVAFSHTVFAMPSALLAVLAASKRVEVRSEQLFYIILALISARTAAMGWNRLIDVDIDAQNPRTKDRELPKGLLSYRETGILILISITLFLYFSYKLSINCLILSPLVLVVLLGYSYTKRFTHYSHLVLGLALALAPGGAWFAVTNTFSFIPVALMLSVLFWVAGFDIIYSIQDYNFDKKVGLSSIPVSFGIERALMIAKILHLIAIVSLAIFGLRAELSYGFWIGYLLFIILIASQHFVINKEKISNINKIFFTRNGWASILLFLASLIGEIV